MANETATKRDSGRVESSMMGHICISRRQRKWKPPWFSTADFSTNIRTDFDHLNARDITEELCPGHRRRIHDGRSA